MTIDPTYRKIRSSEEFDDPYFEDTGSILDDLDDLDDDDDLGDLSEENFERLRELRRAHEQPR